MCELSKGRELPGSRPSRARWACGWVLLLGSSTAGMHAQGMAATPSSETIWPAKGEYVGSRRCAVCHSAQARSFSSSSMSRALESIDNSEILKRNPRLTWTEGAYRYLIEKSGAGYRYMVTDGKESAEV